MNSLFARGNIAAPRSTFARPIGGRHVTGFDLRYVGRDQLPPRLSDFDLERYFSLTDVDVAALNERFRRDRRAGAAVQLLFFAGKRSHARPRRYASTATPAIYRKQEGCAGTGDCSPQDNLLALQDAIRPSGLGMQLSGSDFDRSGTVG